MLEGNSLPNLVLEQMREGIFRNAVKAIPKDTIATTKAITKSLLIRSLISRYAAFVV
jgi:hypothetical protein